MKIHSTPFALVAIGAFLLSAAAFAQPVDQITNPINENVRTVLAGNVRPEARDAQNDRGPVADSLALNGIELLLRRTPAQQMALDQLVEDQQDPQSAHYHKWLSSKDFGGEFGVSDHDVGKIAGWLAVHGFHVDGTSAGRGFIVFSGTAGLVRATFHTEIHNLDVEGIHHIANMSDPQIPAALAPAIAGIVSLNDFYPRPMNRSPNLTFSGCGGHCYTLVPADLATIYNLTPLFDAGIAGKGETIAVVEDSDVFKASDWSKFRSEFGLSGFTQGSFSQVQPAGLACAKPPANKDDGEAILDAEWASAAAPNAKIELASCKNTKTSSGVFTAIENLVNSANPPPIISVSFGNCEPSNGAGANQSINELYEQGASEGISIFVSSGDENAAGCDPHKKAATHGIAVNGWGSTVFNVAVGGTDFGDTFAHTNSTYWNSSNSSVFGSAKSYVPEIPWNDSCASVLLAESVTGSSQTSGSTGFCNVSQGKQFLNTDGAGGGPSGCATGTPSTNNVVSGSCEGYAKPSWQTGFFGIPSDGVRDLPDVSLFAADGVWSHFYIYCNSDPKGGSCSGSPSNWSGGGGTSFASPIMAGIQALVDQKRGMQGNPDATYYKLAATQESKKGRANCNSSRGNGVDKSCIFRDVTQGDIDVNCTGTQDCFDPSGTNGVLSTSTSSLEIAYGAKAGWDFATGIGTVNAANLVNKWPK